MLSEFARDWRLFLKKCMLMSSYGSATLSPQYIALRILLSVSLSLSVHKPPRTGAVLAADGVGRRGLVLARAGVPQRAHGLRGFARLGNQRTRSGGSGLKPGQTSLGKY